MEKQMNKRLKFGLIIAILVLVAIFAAFWVVIDSQQQYSRFSTKTSSTAQFYSR